MARALVQSGMSLLRVGPLEERNRYLNKARQEIHRRLSGKSLHRDREPAVLDGYAEQVNNAIVGNKVRAVLSPGTVAVANLRTELPVIVWPDATFGGLVDFYVWEPPPTARSRRLGNEMEQRALDAAAAVVFSSDWAAQTARKLYHVREEKLHVIPYGANLADEPDAAAVASAIIARAPNSDAANSSSPLLHSPAACRLLFIGTGWLRKGGDVAIAVAQKLGAMGLATELSIVGSDAPEQSALPAGVRRVGYVSKKTPEGRRAFAELVSGSHFLIHPARADASPVVLAEASAFGVPAITTNVGGIPSLVRDGVNGRLFPPDDPAGMAEVIFNLMRDPAAYLALCQSAVAEYRDRLNWATSVAKMKELIERVTG
jgi:glycosyltransferase involved in cell wall biosynthesis